MFQDDGGGVITSIFGQSIQREHSAVSFLNRIPLQKIVIWLSFVGLVFILRDFFGILFTTFVISYIGNSVVDRFMAPGRDRRVLVILYFLAIITLIFSLGFWTVTLAISEGKNFVARAQREDPYITVYNKLQESLPPQVMERLEKAILESEAVNNLRNEHENSQNGDPGSAHHDPGQPQTGETKAPQEGATSTDPKQPGGPETEEDALARKDKARKIGQALQRNLKDYAIVAVEAVSAFLKAMTKGALQTIISLIFSFMIVWDLPAIRRGMGALYASRLGAAYSQVAPSVINFGELLGRAFQAQTIIATMNTALTAVGMLILAIPGIGFLSIVVFVCSFIPVAGMFISTAPIAVVALVNHGLWSALGVVAMVIIVHAIEAYVLNPQIYSAHLKLHPLLVLVVLVFSEHTVGVWGLIVAVPAAVYIYKHVIMDFERDERIATTVDLVA